MPSQISPSSLLRPRLDRLRPRHAPVWRPRRAAVGLPARAWLLLGLGLLVADGARALPLTFDVGEIGGAVLPVNSLGSVMGVTFGYTLSGSDSNAAVYGVSPAELAGGVTDFVSPGVLEGDSAGILTLEFDDPTTSFSFDFAMDESFATLANPVKGFDIELMDEFGGSLGGAIDVFIAIQPSGGNLWAEAQYSYVGGTEIKTVVLDFNEGTFPDRTVFWFDNLDFVPVPEPGTWLLIFGGLMGIAFLGRSSST